MLADQGIGEWGFAALVEAGDHRVLVDTGARPQTVLQNARELHVDLASVQEVVLTHNHDDHVGGLMTLRQELMKTNPAALSRAHVATGIFYSRPAKAGGEDNETIAIKKSYEASGGTFVVHDSAAEIFPGAWLTGPVPRVFPERNWSVTGQVRTPGGLVEDNIPEDQSLVLNTPQGLVVITGCGHAGIVNILTLGAQHIARRSGARNYWRLAFVCRYRRADCVDRGKTKAVWNGESFGRSLHGHRKCLPASPASGTGEAIRSGCRGGGLVRIGRGHPPRQARPIDKAELEFRDFVSRETKSIRRSR